MMNRPREQRHRVIEFAYMLYKRGLSPVLHALAPCPGGCLYQPTCSEYAALACAQHGWLRGAPLALWRVLRCNPFSRGGWDPVPGTPPNRPAQGAQVP